MDRGPTLHIWRRHYKCQAGVVPMIVLLAAAWQILMSIACHTWSSRAVPTSSLASTFLNSVVSRLPLLKAVWLFIVHIRWQQVQWSWNKQLLFYVTCHLQAISTLHKCVPACSKTAIWKAYTWPTNSSYSMHVLLHTTTLHFCAPIHAPDLICQLECLEHRLDSMGV